MVRTGSVVRSLHSWKTSSDMAAGRDSQRWFNRVNYIIVAVGLYNTRSFNSYLHSNNATKEEKIV